MSFLVTVAGSCALPDILVGILTQVYRIIRIIIPVAIIIFGTLDFLKAIMGKDEKEVSPKLFAKRVMYGLLSFFVFVIVEWLFSILSNVDGAAQAFKCASQILNGESGTVLHPDHYGSEEDKQNTCYAETFAKCYSNSKDENGCITAANQECGTHVTTKPASATTTITEKETICRDNCQKDFGISATPYCKEYCNSDNSSKYKNCIKSCLLAGRESNYDCLNECKTQ